MDVPHQIVHRSPTTWLIGCYQVHNKNILLFPSLRLLAHTQPSSDQNNQVHRFPLLAVGNNLFSSIRAVPDPVIKKTNGKVLIYTDFSSGLDAALDLCQCPLSGPEDLFAKLICGICLAVLGNQKQIMVFKNS